MSSKYADRKEFLHQGVENTSEKDYRSEMNLADVTSLANGPVSELIQWLQRQNCIAK